MQSTQDIHVRGTIPLISPRQLKTDAPITEDATRTVVESRDAVKRILTGDDQRMIVVVGPCSIHNQRLAMEYAERLAELSEGVRDQLLLIMRVYFEKPRTSLGWKGLINDPHLDDTFDIAAGLRIARGILLDIANLGLPAGTEMLEPITPQYIADLVTWASIGARTTESPTHRQMASGLSMPVGYKNGTDGNMEVAINAMKAARSPHSFLGIDADGKTCIVQTAGNSWAHLILRGGQDGPNYDAEHTAAAKEQLVAANLPPRFMVDCSHANSDKDYRMQPRVWNSVLDQRLAGNSTIIGFMLESNLKPGNQKLSGDPSRLEYGVSITDGCIGWEETESLIWNAHRQLAAATASFGAAAT